EEGNWALGAKRVDTAKALFDAALKVDPDDRRAQAGAKIVAKLEKGDVSFDDLKKNTVDELVQEKKEVPPPAATASRPAPADPNALLRQAEAQQRIREQQVTVAVEETLARARALLNAGDPRSSKDLLVAQRDTIRVAGDIGENVRQRLLNRIE